MTASAESFFDPDTGTWTHIAWDPATKRAAVIDPVLDYNPQSGRIERDSANRVVEFLQKNGLTLEWILETHAHADHLTAAQVIKERLGGTIVIGEGIRAVQDTFSKVYGFGPEFPVDGRQFDKLIADGEQLSLGDLTLEAMATPGHTSDSMSLRLNDNVFIGDTLFSPQYGTARCDFPGGDARLLYKSVKKLLSMPDDTRLYLCHDYPAKGASPISCVTVAEQAQNKHLKGDVSEDDFVAMREGRDAGLRLPRLLLPAIQVNIRAGRLPEPDYNGVSYLKIPLNQF